MPASLHKWRWPVEKIRRKICEKIYAHTAKPQDQIRRAFRMFGCVNKGITRDVFRDKINRKFGILLTEQETRELFRIFDPKDAGEVDFYDFITGLLEPDYSRRMWFVQRQEIARNTKALDPRGKKVLPTRHKSMTSEENPLAVRASYHDWHLPHPNRRAFGQAETIDPDAVREEAGACG